MKSLKLLLSLLFILHISHQLQAKLLPAPPTPEEMLAAKLRYTHMKERGDSFTRLPAKIKIYHQTIDLNDRQDMTAKLWLVLDYFEEDNNPQHSVLTSVVAGTVEDDNNVCQEHITLVLGQYLPSHKDVDTPGRKLIMFISAAPYNSPEAMAYLTYECKPKPS